MTDEKEVQIDQATNPEDIKSEFLNIINDLRKKGIGQILESTSERMGHKASKEVRDLTEFSSNESAIGAKFIIMFVIMMIYTLGFGAVMTFMMTP